MPGEFKRQKRSRRRKPPIRRCSECGQTYASWNPHAVHPMCPARNTLPHER